MGNMTNQMLAQWISRAVQRHKEKKLEKENGSADEKAQKEKNLRR